MAVSASPQVFIFFSQILGKRILDLEGHPWGKIVDLLASLGELYPTVTGVLYLPRGQKTLHRLPWARIRQVEDKFVFEGNPLERQIFTSPGEGELLLRESLLDKQIVDTHGAKVLRVNDLHLLHVNLNLRLVHVDVGLRGLMRRVGLEKIMDRFFHFFLDYHPSDHLIPWRVVQTLSSPALLRLKVSQQRLAQLHPADLADIIEDLDIHKRAEVFQSLDVETAAETLEETDPKIQIRLIENLSPARASDIIEEMSPSEAADLLGDLPKEKAEGILKEMEKEMAEDVKELLVHHEEKAGGLMTNTFATLSPQATAKEALDLLRLQAKDLDLIDYLYLTDTEGFLLGVVSLRGLLMASAQDPLSNLMEPRVISVNLEAGKKEIANLFAKYGLKAIPVVDETNRIRGVIPFKNLLEVVAPELGK